MSKIVGKARALAVGYYPVNEAGTCKLIEEGEVFDLYEGRTKGKWFEVLDQEPAAKPQKGKGKADDLA